jgi:hypothetical protein
MLNFVPGDTEAEFQTNLVYKILAVLIPVDLLAPYRVLLELQLVSGLNSVVSGKVFDVFRLGREVRSSPDVNTFGGCQSTKTG